MYQLFGLRMNIIKTKMLVIGRQHNTHLNLYVNITEPAAMVAYLADGWKKYETVMKK